MYDGVQEILFIGKTGDGIVSLVFASLLWNKNCISCYMSTVHLGENKGIVNGAYGKVPMYSREAEKERLAVSINTILFDSFFLL